MDQIRTRAAPAEVAADDVEALLTRDARASLPFQRLLVLYLNPFSLFKDSSRGSLLMRASALAYNRSKRWLLLIYLRRWLTIAGASFLGVAPSEALAAQHKPFILVTAGLGMAFAVAVVVALWAAVCYFLLGLRPAKD